MKTKARKIKVLWPDKKGRLISRMAWQIGTNAPQATKKLAEAFASKN